MAQSFLPFNDLNLFNVQLFMDPDYNDQLGLLNQVDLNIYLLDNVIL